VPSSAEEEYVPRAHAPPRLPENDPEGSAFSGTLSLAGDRSAMSLDEMADDREFEPKLPVEACHAHFRLTERMDIP
jgi:hypothetical protein